MPDWDDSADDEAINDYMSQWTLTDMGNWNETLEAFDKALVEFGLELVVLDDGSSDTAFKIERNQDRYLESGEVKRR